MQPWIQTLVKVFSRGYTEIGSREIFAIDSVLKTNPWKYKIKNLNGEKIISSFLRKIFVIE